MMISLLIVSGSPSSQQALISSLPGSNCTVAACGSIEEAGKCLRLLAPDIIVIDRVLPDGDGLGLCPIVRAACSNPVPVIVMLSDEALPKCCPHGQTNEIDHFFLKHDNIKETLSAVSDLLVRLCGSFRKDVSAP